MESLKNAMDSLKPYKLRIFSILTAILIAILLLNIGFFRTLLIALVVGIGYIIGVYFDDKNKFIHWIERIQDAREN